MYYPPNTRLVCCYCRRGLLDPKRDKDRNQTLSLTWDHVKPVSQGGRRTVPCCRQCNQLKADLDPALWRLITDHYEQWWKRFANHNEVRRAAYRLWRDQQGASDANA